VKRGFVHGACDKTGSYPAENPVRPDDLAATIYHSLGIVPRTELQTADARPVHAADGKAISAEFRIGVASHVECVTQIGRRRHRNCTFALPQFSRHPRSFTEERHAPRRITLSSQRGQACPRNLRDQDAGAASDAKRRKKRRAGLPALRGGRSTRESALAVGAGRGYCTRPMKTLATLFLALFATIAFAEDSAKFKVGAFAFTRPAAWKSIEPTSPMRKAQLQVPGKDGGKPADITFFFFGESNGGGVEPNVQRWLGQVAGKPDTNKTEKQDFNGVKVTLVSAEGSLKAAPMAGIAEEIADAALLGAILEHAEGAVFVKMTGPAPLVKASREQFIGLVKSATEKK